MDSWLTYETAMRMHAERIAQVNEEGWKHQQTAARFTPREALAAALIALAMLIAPSLSVRPAPQNTARV